MSTILLLVKSVVAGFIVAVPIGPIGAMCLRRSLQGRWGVGLATGGGAAVADSILAAGAMFGLTLLTRYIFDHQTPLLLVGGFFLVALGARMIHKRHPHLDALDEVADPQTRSVRKTASAFSTGFVLTIINPATLFAFVAVFAGMGLLHGRPIELSANWIVIVGIFIGSMLWWTILTTTAYAVRRHLSLEFVVILNVVLGVVVAGFGIASLLALIGVIPRI